MSDGLLSADEAATLLGVTPAAIKRLVPKGLKAKVVRGELLFRPDAVDEFLEARRVEPGSLPWAHEVWDTEQQRWRWGGAHRSANDS